MLTNLLERLESCGKSPRYVCCTQGQYSLEAKPLIVPDMNPRFCCMNSCVVFASAASIMQALESLLLVAEFQYQHSIEGYGRLHNSFTDVVSAGGCGFLPQEFGSSTQCPQLQCCDQCLCQERKPRGSMRGVRS